MFKFNVLFEESQRIFFIFFKKLNRLIKLTADAKGRRIYFVWISPSTRGNDKEGAGMTRRIYDLRMKNGTTEGTER